MLPIEIVRAVIKLGIDGEILVAVAHPFRKCVGSKNLVVFGKAFPKLCLKRIVVAIRIISEKENWLCPAEIVKEGLSSIDRNTGETVATGKREALDCGLIE